ncbi:Maltose O-acetyltransferase [Acetobacter malorum]|uniref:Nodulation protein L n=1 Tax=Acetobacter malorum TaxID=178901 RepID=A0A087PKJ5_9PROT|nr:sugar O-acetyltransferase [Acetobacter malorum]KFL87898.1 Maltose O-acetyltransferase [Acetobacter malorum]OAG76011.1 Maltose O-acetyltransferase [Acetobacter malorum]
MISPMTEKQKMLAGELYRASDPELVQDMARCAAWLAEYNATSTAPEAERTQALRQQLGAVGENVSVRAPFHCDYGFNIFLGDNVFLNFGCVILDVAPVHIGHGTQIGPGVQILAADHPRDPALRRQLLESGRPVTIGETVWIGGGAIILPGITIGDNAIIGAGSVVTRNVPAGVTVAGNPARILKSTR